MTNFNRFANGPLYGAAPAAPAGGASSELPPVDPAVTRLQGEIAQHRQTLDEIKRQISAQPRMPAQPAQPSQPVDPAAMNREFYKDPVNSTIAIANGVATRMAQAMNNNPELASQRETMIHVAKEQVRNKSEEDRKLWDKFQLEIEATAAQAGPQFLSNINVWENAFRMVKGNHIDEILAERGQAPAVEPARAPAVHIRSGGGPEQPSARPAAAPRGEELSPEEKRTAKRLGITEKQYSDGKKAVAEQNDPVSDPVGKSSWDNMITFDSKERGRKLREEARLAKERNRT